MNVLHVPDCDVALRVSVTLITPVSQGRSASRAAGFAGRRPQPAVAQGGVARPPGARHIPASGEKLESVFHNPGQKPDQ